MSESQKTLDDVKAAFQYFGLEFGASENAVRRKWRDMALKCHPDKNPGNKEATERFQEIEKARDLLDKYADNPKHFPPGPSQRATGIDPYDTHIPSGRDVRGGSFASGNSRGGGTRYYGADGEELFPLPGGGFARVYTDDHPGTSGSAERSFREGHSAASRSDGRRERRQGSSSEEIEVGQDGRKYVYRRPRDKEPEHTPHKKMGSDGKHRERRQGSSSSEDFEIGEDGAKYVIRKPRTKEPEHTPHKEKGRDGKHREGGQGSSSSHRIDVRRNGNTDVGETPTRSSTEPASTSHKKGGKDDKRAKAQRFLVRDRKTGKMEIKKKQ